MQYRTYVIADVPRVQCEEHGVRQIEVPWSDASSRFTALFEALVIDWLREANVRAISRRLRLSWEQVAGIQSRAVKRGLARREQRPPRQIGVDETAFQKRHEYVTVVHDIDEEVVVHVADDRKQEALEGYFEALGPKACAALERVAMDMWAPYIAATRAQVPNADAKIVFDKFHIAKHLGDAVDKVRRQENRELVSEGRPIHPPRGFVMTPLLGPKKKGLTDYPLRTAGRWGSMPRPGPPAEPERQVSPTPLRPRAWSRPQRARSPRGRVAQISVIIPFGGLHLTGPAV
jgi:transposase